MKRNLLLIFILIIHLGCFSQKFVKVDSIVSEYSHKFSKPENLADLINDDFKTDIEKSRAIFTWIALNVKYDVDTYNSKKKKNQSYTYTTKEEKLAKEKELQNDLARTTIKKNKAVCAGYSALFKRLCDLTNIESVVINGSSKTKERDIDKSPKGSDHAWNAVKIEDNWFLIDATWGAGYIIDNSNEFIADFDDIWFMTPPEKFFLKHYPKDEDWLLIKRTEKDFEKLPLYYSRFLTTDFEIIQPETGIITKAPKQQITFKVNTKEDQSNFTYAFQNSKHSEMIEFETKGDYKTFSIPMSNRKTGYLTLYYKNRGIIKYKLMIK